MSRYKQLMMPAFNGAKQCVIFTAKEKPTPEDLRKGAKIQLMVALNEFGYRAPEMSKILFKNPKVCELSMEKMYILLSHLRKLTEELNKPAPEVIHEVKNN